MKGNLGHRYDLICRKKKILLFRERKRVAADDWMEMLRIPKNCVACVVHCVSDLAWLRRWRAHAHISYYSLIVLSYCLKPGSSPFYLFADYHFQIFVFRRSRKKTFECHEIMFGTKFNETHDEFHQLTSVHTKSGMKIMFLIRAHSFSPGFEIWFTVNSKMTTLYILCTLPNESEWFTERRDEIKNKKTKRKKQKIFQISQTREKKKHIFSVYV